MGPHNSAPSNAEGSREAPGSEWKPLQPGPLGSSPPAHSESKARRGKQYVSGGPLGVQGVGRLSMKRDALSLLPRAHLGEHRCRRGMGVAWQLKPLAKTGQSSLSDCV